MAKIQQKFGKICKILGKTATNSVIFNEKFEIRERPYVFQKEKKGERPYVVLDSTERNGAYSDSTQFKCTLKHNEKEKQKGNSNDFRTTVIRQKEPRYPPHIHSLLS